MENTQDQYHQCIDTVVINVSPLISAKMSLSGKCSWIAPPALVCHAIHMYVCIYIYIHTHAMPGDMTPVWHTNQYMVDT